MASRTFNESVSVESMEEISDSLQVPRIWEEDVKAPYIESATLPTAMEKLLEL